MKQLIFLLSATLLMAACKNVTTKNPKEPIDPNAKANAEAAFLNDSTKWTKIKWLDSLQNFGKVTDGEKVVITFHFKNIGNMPLIIAAVTPSCGCTVPSKPDEPIAPGAEGIITAEFNSSGRVGKADKYINVSCNTAQEIYTLKFEGEVIEKSKN